MPTQSDTVYFAYLQKAAERKAAQQLLGDTPIESRADAEKKFDTITEELRAIDDKLAECGICRPRIPGGL